VVIPVSLSDRGFEKYRGVEEQAGPEMTSGAFDFRDHPGEEFSLAAFENRHPHQVLTNIVDINERLPLHLDMVVSDHLAKAVLASRKAGASDHRIFRRMAELAASVLDDPTRPEPSPEGPEEALRFFKMLAPAFFDLELTPAHMSGVLRYFAAAMAGEIEVQGIIEEATASVLAHRVANRP
jgi:hypothetical protein